MVLKYHLLFLLGMISFMVNGQDDYVQTKPDKKKRSAILFSKIDNPDFTNYMLTASAFTLKERDIRVSGTDIIFAKGSYGLSNYTTASINASLFGMTVGAIKHRIELSENLNWGFSGSLGSLATINQDSIVFVTGAQSMLTLGDHQDNLTVGTGYYYVKSTFNLTSDNNQLSLFQVYLALQKQISRRVYIIGEALYLPEYHVITGGMSAKITIKDDMSLVLGVMPISQEFLYVNNRKIRDSIILPFASFRMLLDRH